MQYLGLALYAEGPTDYYFLRPLLQRLCEDICTREANSTVEVSEVLGLGDQEQGDKRPRGERIASSAQSARGAWKILFVHADGSNDPKRARDEQVDPGLALVRQHMKDVAGVGVVPIRETEAWIIADGDALRSAFGTGLSDEMLGLPTGQAVEGIRDPKKTLHATFVATHPSSRRLRHGISPYLNTLGEQVSLTSLRKVPSFCSLENELRNVLREFGVIG